MNAKRGRGRPKGSGAKRGPKPKVEVQAVAMPVSDDEQDVHLNLKPAAVDPQPSGHNPVHISELEERLNDMGDSWETESLFEDIIEDLTENKPFEDLEDACTREESVKYRLQLQQIGPENFCKVHVDSGAVTAKKLLTAFGVRPPAFLEGQEDHRYYSLLVLALTRELSKRAKLPHFNTVDDAATLLNRSKNIVVITGAGISTSLGIPDFRSKETGLYSKLANSGLAINDPQEVFNIEVFREDPTIFFSVAKDILPESKKFSPTHAFIAMLQNQGKLLTNYSQNIDNIEANAGIRPDKLVQCHGSFATASCQKCGYKVPGDAIFVDIRNEVIPRCTKCIAALRSKGNMKRKRSNMSKRSSSGRRPRHELDDTDDEEYDFPSAGVMKPDITFFGENLPDEFHDRLVKHDRDLVDLVIVIGTSLKVAPVSEVVPYLPPHIPQIYISKTPISHINFDIDLIGDCDVVVAELCRRAGWALSHEMIPQDQQVKIDLEEGYESRHLFSTVEPGSSISGPVSNKVAKSLP